MTQNIYDNDVFFAGYGQLDRSLRGLDGAPEWPTLRGLLPDMTGMRVLDLGCGFGWFCRWARANGAAHVLGIDVSENMLARARAMTDDSAIAWRRADLEQVDLPTDAFDLVYSSLALHYIVDLEGLLAKAHAALASGGALVCSVEHPLTTAPSLPEWSIGKDGRAIWPVNRYLDEGPRSVDWLAADVIKQHRTIETYVTLLLRLGFVLTELREWGPELSHIDAAPEEWGANEAEIAVRRALARERQRPFFLLLAAKRV